MGSNLIRSLLFGVYLSKSPNYWSILIAYCLGSVLARSLPFGVYLGKIPIVSRLSLY